MENFDNYLFRCHSLGKIVSKSGKLTETIKSYLQELYTQETKKQRKIILSKYFEKGKYCEQDGFDILQQALYEDRLIVKNTERKENEYIIGECDNVAPDNIIHDIKNAYDQFTFDKAELSHEHEWQGKGYMFLWNLYKFRLFYCLNNMPEHLLVKEERILFYSNNFTTMEDPDYLELCEEIRAKNNYDHLPLYKRFKFWELEFTTEDKETIINSVKVARSYMNDLMKAEKETWIANLTAMGKSKEIKGIS